MSRRRMNWLTRLFCREPEPFRPLVYLAVPYSHPDPEVRELRYQAANHAAKYLMEWGHTVFSPITSSHPLALLGFDGDWEFWKKQDTDFLKCSHKLFVLPIPGWKESTGVTEEIKIAKELGIPVEEVSVFSIPDDLADKLWPTESYVQYPGDFISTNAKETKTNSQDSANKTDCALRIPERKSNRPARGRKTRKAKQGRATRRA